MDLDDKENTLELASSSEIPKHILISPSPSQRSMSAGGNNGDSPDLFRPGPLWPLDDIDCTGTLAQNPPTDASPPRGETGEETRRFSITACCRAPLCSSCLRCGRFTAPIILFCLVSFIFIALGRGYLTLMLSWLENLPLSTSLVVFVLLFTLISFPFGFGYIILNTTAGYLYGLVRGQAIVTVSVAIGFTVAFLLCRSCLREWSSQYLSSPTLMALMRVVEGPHGLKVIILTRFTPVPFGLQNSLFAMTNVSFTKVFVGSVLGLFPTQLLNTYMGSTVRNFKEILADRADGYIILILQIIVTIILSLYVVHKAKQELSKLAKPHDIESGLSEER